jgi:aerobic carbon-monoxide dehydrogenase medium subunit
MRQGLLNPGCLINIQHISELKGIEPASVPSPLAAEGGGEGAYVGPPSPAGNGQGLRLGALSTHNQAARSTLVCDHYPALADTFRHVATPRIRNAGTVGGNLAHGDPHLDPPVTLLALDARVAAQSTRGRREVHLSELFRDYYETSLSANEILTEVILPPPAPGSGAAFIKFLPRSQDDYATVDVAAWIKISSSGGKIDDARVALGSVGPVPFRAVDAESFLKDAGVIDGALTEAGERAAAACDPEDDVRGSAAYKREVVKVLVGRAVRQAVEQARTNGGGAA